MFDEESSSGADPLCTMETWGSRRRWHRFIFPEEIARNFVQSLSIVNPGGRIISIMHCDMECRFSTPPRTGRSATFYSYPWPNPLSSYVMGVHHQPNAALASFKALETDLTAADVASGWAAGKLGRLFRALKPYAGKKDVLLVNLTCLPMKTGDSKKVKTLLKRYRIQGEVLYNDPEVDQSVPPVLQLVRSRIVRAVSKRTRSKRTRKKRRSINLVGFPKCPEKYELILLLSELGISVNVDMIPEVNIEELDDFSAAGFTVFFPEIHFNVLYEDIFGNLALKGLRPAAPYGMEGSRQWLRQIAVGAGVEKKFDKYWRSWFSQVRREWMSRVKEAGEFTAAVVGTPEDLKRFSNPLHTAGISVLSVLLEMGFKLEFFVYLGQESDSNRSAIAPFMASKFPASREKINVASFSSPEELRDVLLRSKSRIVYSDIFFDGRITACGKTTFSVDNFEMGPSGCLKTIEYLTGSCRLPFFEKYAAYLV